MQSLKFVFVRRTILCKILNLLIYNNNKSKRYIEMKKNWKFTAYGMTAATILSMTACSTDDKTVNISFAGDQTQETETSNFIIAETKTQETATPSFTEGQDPFTVAPSSTNEQTQNTKTTSPSSTNGNAQDSVMASTSPANEEARDTKTTPQSSANEEALDPETDDTYLIFENPVYLEDYYNTPAGKMAIDADYADLAGEGMSVAISVVMDEINVTIQYEDNSLLTEGIAEKLAQQLDSMTDRFWQRTIAYDEHITWRCVLTVRYIDAEGNILAEQGYSAE